MIRRPPRSTLSSSSAASDVYKRQVSTQSTGEVPTATMVLRHSSVAVHTGITMHTVECAPPQHVACKGVVMLIHGFPDSWFGWRHQLHAIAQAGFHVICPDQRGYGFTCTTEVQMDTADFCMEKLCADNLGLMDAMGVHTAVFLGHDWGGTLVWNLCLHHPDRCSTLH
eukprot:TRINITY_DN7207_c0_g1_i1.p2 TRINITY_DN7207_c0_g1~~TRINITY_DN7207_c0_g1_i1.p2  ORF type:complete len:168 (+),score=36.82 TRINITY_DN7207_c0_g1_i1:122-625(+)